MGVAAKFVAVMNLLEVDLATNSLFFIPLPPTKIVDANYGSALSKSSERRPKGWGRLGSTRPGGAVGQLGCCSCQS